jgi:hypothetical protein
MLSMKNVLIVLLNSIKQFDLKTYQSGSLPNSSFELNHMRADLK